MLSDILVAVMIVAALAAGVFAWWIDNGGTSEKNKEDSEKDPKKHQRKK